MSEVVVNKFYKLSWDEFYGDTKDLAERLKKTGKKWSGIVAVARGGLVPAAIIAEELGIRTVETISMISYNEDDNNPEIQSEVKIVKPAVNVGDGTGWLVVDDLVDTGRTVETLRHLWPEAFFATVYAKPKGRRFSDSFVREFKQDTWLFFPWALVNAENDL